MGDVSDSNRGGNKALRVSLRTQHINCGLKGEELGHEAGKSLAGGES